MKFRKKPFKVIVNAVQWNGQNMDDLANLMGYWQGYRWGKQPGQLLLDTYSGEIKLSRHDWLVKSYLGELYACDPNSFKVVYEPETIEATPTEEEMLDWAKKHEQNNNPRQSEEELLKWTENLVQVLKEAVEYLDNSNLNYITSTSILHKKMKEAIKKSINNF